MARPGSFWRIVVQFQLFQGDCIEVMRGLPDKSVNLVCCDLPYGTTNCEWDNLIEIDDLWDEYRRLLAKGGCVVLFGAMPFTARLVASNYHWFKDHLVWNKNKCGSPGLANIRPMRVHEDILVFAPGRTTYNPQMTTGTPYSRKSKNPEGYVGKKNDHGYGLKPRTEFHNDGTRFPKSIVDISRDFSAQQQVHAAQKPVPLLTWLVNTYSNPGDVVLDNAMGSGTTGVACAMTGRRFVGIDTNPEHVKLSRERIVAAQCEASGL